MTLMGFLVFGFAPPQPHHERVSCNPDWPQTHHVAEDNLELLVLLPLPPGCWNYRQETAMPSLHGAKD